MQLWPNEGHKYKTQHTRIWLGTHRGLRKVTAIIDAIVFNTTVFACLLHLSQQAACNR